MRLKTPKLKPCFSFYLIADVPDIVSQDYAVPHMQDLLPKVAGGYISVRSNPPTLNSIFPKPPPVPPPPEKYYAATPVLKSQTTPTTPSNNNSYGGLVGGGNIGLDFDSANTLPLNGLERNSNNGGIGFGTLATTTTTPSAAIVTGDDDVQLHEFPRDKLVIIEKLGSGVFGELHLCETKGLRYVKKKKKTQSTPPFFFALFRFLFCNLFHVILLTP